MMPEAGSRMAPPGVLGAKKLLEIERQRAIDTGLINFLFDTLVP